MRLLLITYGIILILGLSAMLTGIHYLANFVGFISAVGFLIVFFKDRPDEETEQEIKMRRYWYIVFATGIFFSMLFGSFWNTHMGNMEPR
jgi:amino acid transporter